MCPDLQKWVKFDQNYVYFDTTVHIGLLTTFKLCPDKPYRDAFDQRCHPKPLQKTSKWREKWWNLTCFCTWKLGIFLILSTNTGIWTKVVFGRCQKYVKMYQKATTCFCVSTAFKVKFGYTFWSILGSKMGLSGSPFWSNCKNWCFSV